ncbi:hypothetical protein C8P63_1029 [Melghirimyces profundicolus]|uniref:WYL domain-containing protein n=1 Tax=Melghirimyces profundicolus TaxID=1242148 RepID=A0A2T6C8B2_9BACL|nr:hypothetical protein [Melghirimyces profundicolus]PTX64516.1 hypothetical protein C8P63_1029 [Melghirimyces profundicolus]
MRTVLNQAARRKEAVEVIYLDRQGRLTQRKVWVLGMDGDTVRVYCCKRRQFRRLRREGILAAARTEAGFGKRAGGVCSF